MAIHLAGHHATCCDSSELAELPTQSSNKRWPSVGCTIGLCLSTKSGNDEHIEYKLLSLTHEVLTATYAYLNDMILLYVKSLRPKLATESTAVTPARPSTSCSSRYK